MYLVHELNSYSTTILNSKLNLIVVFLPPENSCVLSLNTYV